MSQAPPKTGLGEVLADHLSTMEAMFDDPGLALDPQPLP
jgi:hypothetical protein